MKTCSKCKIEKDASEFYVKKTNSDGLQCHCKDCCRKYSRDLYHQDPLRYKDSRKTNRLVRTKYLSDLSEKIKSELGCAICGEDNACALDFHHHKEKGIRVGQAARRGCTRYETEVNKCVVLCATCHRKTHAGLISVTDDMLCNVKVVSPDELNDKTLAA